jgi:hypothetical protein
VKGSKKTKQICRETEMKAHEEREHERRQEHMREGGCLKRPCFLSLSPSTGVNVNGCLVFVKF